jgi:hypothetical protein
MSPIEDQSDTDLARQRRRRAEHRGIFLALGVNAAVFATAQLAARFEAGPWPWVVTNLLGVLQLAWIAPLAMLAAHFRPRSGFAKGLVLGAAISFIISAGYCCKDSKPAPKPAPRPPPTPTSAALDFR